MTSKIQTVDIRVTLKDPTQPEIWVGVVAAGASPSTDVRGRLMGPRCKYSSTVEVALPFRSASRLFEGLPGIVRRAIIPEASQWEPTHPFLYEGPVELWEADQVVDARPVRCGIRYLHLGNRGLRLNGRLLTIQGVARNTCTAGEMTQLREQGTNLLLVDVATAPDRLWADADEVGMLVLGSVPGDPAAIAQACERQTHPANVGWLLERAIFEDAALRAIAAPLLERRGGELIGIRAAAADRAPPEALFRFGPPGGGLPCLSSEAPFDAPGLIGMVRS